MPRLIPMPIFFCISAGVVGVDDDAEAHAKAERTSRLRMSKRCTPRATVRFRLIESAG